MNKIPPEIRDSIIRQVLGPYAGVRIAQYATISRLWQSSIERHIFRSLKVNTDELDTFAGLFMSENISRRAILTSLEITFILPSPPNGPGCCPVERIPNREADTNTFSESVAKLFSVLADLEKRTEEKVPLMITFFQAFRMSQYKWPPSTSRVPCSRDQGRHSRSEVAEANAQVGTFGMVGENRLVTLKDVKSLELRSMLELRYLEPGYIPKLFERLPSMESLFIQTEDYYGYGRNRRLALREGIRNACSMLSGAQMRHFSLRVAHRSIRNETLQPHKLIREDQWDKEAWFSLVKHSSTAFPNLATLDLRGGLVICPQFFQSIEGGSFLSLRELLVDFVPETADGRWFYQRDDEAYQRSRADPEYAEWWEEMEDESEDSRDIDSDEDFHVFGDGPLRTGVVKNDWFRAKPNETTLLPLLLDAAKAVEGLPQLQKFILSLKDVAISLGYPGQTRVFELWYIKAGTLRSPKGRTRGCFPKVHCDEKYLRRNRLYWRVDKWTPWEEVQTAWGKIVGPDAKIVWIDEENWTKENGIEMNIYEGEF